MTSPLYSGYIAALGYSGPESIRNAVLAGLRWSQQTLSSCSEWWIMLPALPATLGSSTAVCRRVLTSLTEYNSSSPVWCISLSLWNNSAVVLRSSGRRCWLSVSAVRQWSEVDRSALSLNSFGRRCFGAAVPSTWNSLLDSLYDPVLSLNVFSLNWRHAYFEILTRCIQCFRDIRDVLRMHCISSLLYFS